MNAVQNNDQISLEQVAAYASRKCTTCWGLGVVSPARADSGTPVLKTEPCGCAIRRIRLASARAQTLPKVEDFSPAGVELQTGKPTLPALAKQDKLDEARGRKVARLEEALAKARADYQDALDKQHAATRAAGERCMAAELTLREHCDLIDGTETELNLATKEVEDLKMRIALAESYKASVASNLADLKAATENLRLNVSKTSEEYSSAYKKFAPLVESTLEKEGKLERRLATAKARL